MSLRKTPVIIDCDPGHDDAIALLLAFASEKLDVKAVTVTGGNQTLEKTLNNTKRILAFAGIKTRVAKGADKPMLRELKIAPEVHGESGLDGPDLPNAPDYPVEELPAVEVMKDILLSSQEKVVLIPTGPLTNIGILLSLYPQVKEHIDYISLMGGAVVGGNWSPAAEFNILVDPEAAKIVFDSGIHIVMSGLDVTHKAMVYPNEAELFRDQGGKVSVLVAELLDFFFKFHQGEGFEGSPLHDPCAVAYVIDKELFRSKKYVVEIETAGEFTTGATVADFFGTTGKEPNVEVLLDVDREAFLKLLCENMAKYDV